MCLRRTACCLAVILGLTLGPAAHARDTALHLPVKDVIEDPESKARLGSDIALYFGKQATPAIVQSLAEVTTNKKTSAFGKSDETACRWVMLSALLQLVESARNQGGDAVVEIRSDYKRVEWVSDTEYECHVGGLIAGVALKGKIVKLKK
jgi:uncharacterized protein YbjQ (UPF0145 family)